MSTKKIGHNSAKVKLWFVFLPIFASFFFLPTPAQSYRTICDGIEHSQVTTKIKDLDVKMNILRLDPRKVRLDVIHARDMVNGTETTSSIAKRYNAIAAINAGFFRSDRSIYAGNPAGILMIDRNLLSMSYNGRVAVGLVNSKDKTDIEFGHVETEIFLRVGKKKIPLSGINRERKSNEIILFTNHFGRTTLTDPNGWEFVFEGTKRTPLIGRLIAIFKNKGSSIIPTFGFVISASGDKARELASFLKKGLKASWSFRLNVKESEVEPFFARAEDITNGVPQLIRKGNIEITWQQEKANPSFVETRHPRTAIAKLRDGQILIITVDGRSEESGGLALTDLAKILLDFGATDAINLDGGGSTTMVLKGEVINRPSDKEGERAVSDAILIFPRKACLQ